MTLLMVRGGGKNLTINNLKTFKNVSLQRRFYVKNFKYFFLIKISKIAIANDKFFKNYSISPAIARSRAIAGPEGFWPSGRIA